MHVWDGHQRSNASQGFIEGKYVPLGEGEDVTASMDIVEADNPDDALAQKAGNGALGGTRAKIE